MSQFGAIEAARWNSGVTNGKEIGAYAIAQAAKIAVTYAVSFTGLLSPLYRAAFRSGGAMGVMPVTFVVSIVWGGGALLLFLALRAALGGVPTVIASPGGEKAFTSRGGEIGAFVIAYLLMLIVVQAVSSLYLTPIYVALGRNGQSQIVFAIGLSISLVNAALVYSIFVGLRAAFCRPASQ